ncbi:MAG: tetratricopeptide repeat protein, partial [Candidatus Riflebacteria bacterium]|nr:tetratricopeptide repeat protein [Candidatus Riflebacteria bacterium]
GDGPTFRSDLYSLGILLFELLTGSVPFRSPDALAVLRSHLEVPPPDLSAIRPDIPAGVAAIVSKTLAKDPTQRHESAAELRRALIQELGRSPDASSKFLQVSRDGLAGTGTPGASTIRVERRNRHAATPGTIAVAPSADLGEARPAARLRFRLGLAVAGLAIIVATMGLFRWRGSGSVAIPAPGELPGEIGRLVEEGRSDEAKELLRRLLEPGAGEQGAFYFRGVNPAERTRRLTAAAAAYESVVATRGSDPDAWYGLAVIRSAQGDSVKARAACEKVMALQPRHALASFLLGFHRTASGQPSEDLFRVAADADPGLLDAQFYLGSALSTKGFGKDETTMAEAERRLRLSLPGSTDPARARLALAPVLRCASGGSLAAYRRQSQSNAHILLAMRARKKGRFGEAEDHHREAVAVDPRSIGAHQDFAIFLEDRGRHEEALRECRRALELDPRPGIARSMLGRLLARTGRTAEAEREYRNALVRDGKDERARLALAHLLLRRRDLPGAIRELESGVRSAPENPNLRLFLAERLRDAARHREAEVELRRVLAVRPDDAEARFKLGLTLAALDQPERAEAELRRAVPLGSTDPRHLIETAKFLADRMKLTDAETYCRRTLSIAPENADAVKLRDTLKVFNLVK